MESAQRVNAVHELRVILNYKSREQRMLLTIITNHEFHSTGMDCLKKRFFWVKFKFIM